ncbi:MAG: transporter substrate-binding protein [Sulfurimonadaceae bacterium]|jgi:urea transport system substrate-binding protein|nr:transporter substrate-binding protein [Sulfurimonadaceae bacterium]
MRFLVLCGVIVLFILGALFMRFTLEKDSIKVGLIYSQSGTMATSEAPVALMFKAAIKELNDNGGILSKNIEIIEYDAASDPKEFHKGAEELIQKGVVSIFGCWTSASRKEVKKVVEKYDNLLFYPLQYEGLEISPNIIYLGLSANQQINPTLDFIQTHFGKNIYLIGSDYIYPRAANFYIKELSKLTELKIVAERYIPLESDVFGDLFLDILEKKPDAIINTLNGDSNIAFFTQLKKHKITAHKTPVFSLSLDESLVSKMSDSNDSNAIDSMVGHFATWGYFNVLNKNKTNTFTNFLHHYFKEDVDITDAMFSIYMGVQIFKEAIIKGNSATPKEIQKNIKRGSYNLSGDIYFVDPNTNHLYRHTMIGKINPKNDFDILWHSPQIIKPQPYPTFKSKKEWYKCVDTFHVNQECKSIEIGENNE